MVAVARKARPSEQGPASGEAESDEPGDGGIDKSV